MGWIIPYSWQEPGYGGEFEPEEPEINDELDDEGYLIIQN